MRIVFMGTPAFAVPVLTDIVAAGHTVVAAYTRAPQPGGRRGLAAMPSPAHAAAEGLHIPVLTPRTLRDPAAAEIFRGHGADVAVVVAYGLILPTAILDAPPRGCLNLHASLLPRWRGAAPIQRAIMAGDAVTGAAVMKMEAGLDTGPVGLSEVVAIGRDMTASELADALAKIGAGLMVRALDALGRHALVFTPQAKAGVTYAHKIDKAEARIDWSKPAREVHDLIRGLSPFPGAFFEADVGKARERIKILRTTEGDGQGPMGTVLDTAPTIACGTGALRLLEVQRAGKAPMPAADFMRGTRIAVGACVA